MNWGHKIVIIYGIFVVGILFLVYKSSHQKMDLVTADYYDKELKYQQIIDSKSRTNALPDTVEYGIVNMRLQIRFPQNFSGKKLGGEVVLYCPSDEAKDFKQSFSIQNNYMEIPVNALQKGAYELHLSWQADGVGYYLEKKITL